MCEDEGVGGGGGRGGGGGGSGGGGGGKGAWCSLKYNKIMNQRTFPISEINIDFRGSPLMYETLV